MLGTARGQLRPRPPSSGPPQTQEDAIMVLGYGKVVAIAALTLGVVGLPARSHADCASDDPTGSLRAAARMDVVANCDCTGALTHGAYVKCSADRLKNNNPTLPKSCRGRVQKCAAK